MNNNDKADQPGRSSTLTEPAREPARAGLTNANAPHANVDRLIELASDKKPSALATKGDPAKDKSGNSGPNLSEDKPMWKILLQLKPLLPYLTRLLPLLDLGLIPAQNAGLSNEVRQAVTQTTAKIQAIQSEVSAAVQEQALQLKQLEEELTRLLDASEKHAAAQAGLARELASTRKLVSLSAAGLGVLFIALIVMTAVILGRLPH